MESHIIRTRYKLGNVLVQHGHAREGGALMEKARWGRWVLKGIAMGVEDSADAFDSLVPYWAW
jgi:hypothetical protein